MRREAARLAALSYLADPLAPEAAAEVAAGLGVLKQAVGGGAAFLGPPPGGARPPSHQQQMHLLEVVTALQRLGHGYAPLRWAGGRVGWRVAGWLGG